MYTPSIGAVASLAFSPTRISLRKQKLNILICVKLCFTKFVCSAIVRCLKMFNADWEKARFVKDNFQKFSSPYSFSIIFIIVLKRRSKQTGFFITKKWGGDWLSLNTSRIFLARCQLSYLESPLSKTSGAKILLRSDCRKYKNFNESLLLEVKKRLR